MDKYAVRERPARKHHLIPVQPSVMVAISLGRQSKSPSYSAQTSLLKLIDFRKVISNRLVQAMLMGYTVYFYLKIGLGLCIIVRMISMLIIIQNGKAQSNKYKKA